MVDKFRQVKGKTQGCQGGSVLISSLDVASPCQVARDGALRQQVLSGSSACPCCLQDSDKGSRQCTTGCAAIWAGLGVCRVLSFGKEAWSRFVLVY